MWTLCITYDLRKPGRDYSDLYTYLKSFSDWCHPVESVLLVNTDKSPKAVRDEVWKYMDDNDGLLVFRAASPGAWAGLSDEISKWLKDNL